MSNDVLVSRDGQVLHLVLNRPKKKNAITQAMYSTLTAALAEASTDGSVRAVVISGGTECFCAGNDIQDFMAGGLKPDAPVVQFLGAISSFGKPLIAAVAGPAVGIGTTLLFHCDLVYAAPNTQLKTPFVDLALVPEAGSSLLMPAGLGYQRAAGMLLLGESMGAEQAHVAGLVNAIVPAEEVVDTALAAAQRLAKKPPGALRMSKGLMRSASKDAVQQRIREEAIVFAGQLKSPEAQEAFMAFMQRRAPDFSAFE